MSGLIVSSALFSGEPVWTEVEFAEGQTAEILLCAVDGDMDAEYTRQRGLDEQTVSIRMRPRTEEDENLGAGEFRPRVEFEPVSRTLSNSKELKAAKWLVQKIVKGWRGIKMEDGSELEFSGSNLAKLAAQPSFWKPVIEKGYDLLTVKKTAAEGN
jgi:hypothetical protein